nr:phage integrase N-terminal SAM-like domain-containing protein [Candidatus Propionivibrio aalborgensis]
MAPSETPVANAAPKFLDQVRARIRVKHYSIRTETQYVFWVKRFILFHGKRHPLDMGAGEVEAFLSNLAVNGRVSASTQNQALSALLFLYREVLEIALPWLNNVTRAKPSQRLPVVPTPAEVRAVLDRMVGTHGLMARLLYGTGMRLMEGVRLRVKDVDFGRNEILIRDGKGAKDRVTMLPVALAAARASGGSARDVAPRDSPVRKSSVGLLDGLRLFRSGPTLQGDSDRQSNGIGVLCAGKSPKRQRRRHKTSIVKCANDWPESRIMLLDR